MLVVANTAFSLLTSKLLKSWREHLRRCGFVAKSLNRCKKKLETYLKHGNLIAANLSEHDVNVGMFGSISNLLKNEQLKNKKRESAQKWKARQAGCTDPRISNIIMKP